MSNSKVKKLLVILVVITMLFGTVPAYALGTMGNEGLVDEENKHIANDIKPDSQVVPNNSESADFNQRILEDIKTNHEMYVKGMDDAYNQAVAQLDALNKQKSSNPDNEKIAEEIMFYEYLKDYAESQTEIEKAIYSDLVNAYTGKTINPTIKELETNYTEKIKSVSKVIDLLDAQKKDSANKSDIEKRIKLLKHLKYNLGYEFNFIYTLNEEIAENEDTASVIGYGVVINNCPTEEELLNINKEIEFPYNFDDNFMYPTNGYCLEYEFNDNEKIDNINVYDSYQLLLTCFYNIALNDNYSEEMDDFKPEYYSNQDYLNDDDLPSDDFNDADSYYFYYDNGFADGYETEHYSDHNNMNDDFNFGGHHLFNFDDDPTDWPVPSYDTLPDDYCYCYDDDCQSCLYKDDISSILDYYDGITLEYEARIDSIEIQISEINEKITILEKELETSNKDDNKQQTEKKISLFKEKVNYLSKIECILIEQCNKYYEELSITLETLLNETDVDDFKIDEDLSHQVNAAETESSENLQAETEPKDKEETNAADTIKPEDSNETAEAVKEDKSSDDMDTQNNKNESKPENTVNTEVNNNSNISWYDTYKEKVNSGIEQFTVLKNKIVNQIIEKVS